MENMCGYAIPNLLKGYHRAGKSETKRLAPAPHGMTKDEAGTDDGMTCYCLDDE